MHSRKLSHLFFFPFQFYIFFCLNESFTFCISVSLREWSFLWEWNTCCSDATLSSTVPSPTYAEGSQWVLWRDTCKCNLLLICYILQISGPGLCNYRSWRSVGPQDLGSKSEQKKKRMSNWYSKKKANIPFSRHLFTELNFWITSFITSFILVSPDHSSQSWENGLYIIGSCVNSNLSAGPWKPSKKKIYEESRKR